MSAPEPSCAHLRVSYRTEPVGGGAVRGWWACDRECGTRFYPSPAFPNLDEALAAAKAEGAREALESAAKEAWAMACEGENASNVCKMLFARAAQPPEGGG